MAILNKQECVTTNKMLKISKSIADMKELVNSNNANHVYALNPGLLNMVD